MTTDAEPLHPAGEHLLNPLSWRGLAVVGATFRRLLAFPATANFATDGTKRPSEDF
jgi:hypothetical protein